MDSQGVWKGALLCTGECVWSGDAYMGVCRDAGDQGDSAFLAALKDSQTERKAPVEQEPWLTKNKPVRMWIDLPNALTHWRFCIEGIT